MNDEAKDDQSLRAQLAGLALAKDDERSGIYNAAIGDVLKVFDLYENERKKRSARAIARRKNEGKKTGGDLPYGYELGPDGETLQESSYEQRVIVTARKLRANCSLREVARRLKKQKLFPREFLQGLSKRNEFHAAQIKRMTDEET